MRRAGPVTEVASGQAALDVLAREEGERGGYEMIVIDIAMPGLSGVETVVQARRR